MAGPADRRRGLGEFGRIDRYYKPLAAAFPGSLGLTDDAAVFSVPEGAELVVTVDALVEGVHFLPDDPPALLARKALRVNLSDLAAMAADPLAYALVTALPKGRPDSWLEAFAAGLAEDQSRFGFPLMGGDSVSTPGPAMLSVTAFGTVPAGGALRRSGGRAGDRIYVSGTLGDAALGLRALRGELAGLDPAHRDFLAGRYRLPQPRLELVPMLRRVASAGLDVSDGLAADLGHLCTESGLAAVIRADALPLSEAGRAALARWPDLAALPLTGGDDYEIVFSVPLDRAADAEALARAAGVPVTQVGHLEEGPAGTVTILDAGGSPVPLGPTGWQHF